MSTIQVPCEWGRLARRCNRVPTAPVQISPTYGGERVHYCAEHREHPATLEAERGYPSPLEQAEHDLRLRGADRKEQQGRLRLRNESIRELYAGRKRTMDEIGAIYGLSRQRIEQIVKMADG